MSHRGAGGVLIVRIEMHLAAAMKILGNAGNNLQERLLSQAFFAHHFSVDSCYVAHDISSKLQRVAQPAFASSSEKVVTTQRPTHAEMMFDRIFLERKEFTDLWFMGTFQKSLNKDWAPSQKKTSAAATTALRYTGCEPKACYICTSGWSFVQPRCLQRSVCTVHSGWMAKTKDAGGCWNAVKSSWQNFTWIPGCRLQTCSSFLALHVPKTQPFQRFLKRLF